jgi:hypothetical protein
MSPRLPEEANMIMMGGEGKKGEKRMHINKWRILAE